MSRKTKQPTHEAAPEKRGGGRPRGSTKLRDTARKPPPTPKKSYVKKSPNTERVAFSIPEFCSRNGISASGYLNLRKAGLGPREMRPSGKPNGTVLISAASEAAWQRECEQRVVSEEERAADREKRAKAHAAKG